MTETYTLEEIKNAFRFVVVDLEHHKSSTNAWKSFEIALRGRYHVAKDPNSDSIWRIMGRNRLDGHSYMIGFSSSRLDAGRIAKALNAMEDEND